MSPELASRVKAANPVQDEQLEELFGDDASARLLREIRDRRVVPMNPRRVTETSFESPRQPESPWWRRGWIAALSAAAAVVLIIGVVAFLQSDDDPPVGGNVSATTNLLDSTDVTATTAPATAAPVDPIAVIVSSNEAYNAGDVDAWLMHFSEDAVIAGSRRSDAAATFAPVFAANAERFTQEPCRLVEASADGSSTIECDHLEVNDFNGPAGFTHTDTVGYIVGADGLITFVSVASGDYRTVTRFETLFWFWLEETHPEVFAQIESELEESGDNPPGAGGRFPETAADMELALRYVSEFVAQSDAYPLLDQ